MKIGVIVAMEKELHALEKLGAIDGNEIVLQQCGIGKVNAAVGAAKMIEHHHPDCIISTGCAGGTKVDMKVGDVVVGTECCYHDVYCGTEVKYGQLLGMPPRFAADERLVEKTKLIDKGDITLHHGLIATGDWFVTTKEKTGYILDRHPEAVAIDMESCAIAQTCHIYGVPFISFRVISDVPLRDTDGSEYFDFWDRLADSSFHITKSYLEII